ncbi:MAG: DUF2066 domain-containing protein [Alphaproteobacteria bacterium]|nr:DUF2066 domain-containing protein [Alphaproteobacteria bacterium]
MTYAWRHGPLLALTLLLLGALPAAGQRGDAGETLEIARVPIEAQAADGTRAKERALAEGRVAAFQRLLQRMVLAEDQRRLDTLPAAEVARLVASFGIDEERIGPGHYKALLTVAFAAEPVKRLLRDRGIPYALTAARPAVVLPVLSVGADATLWDEPNPWRQAWSALGGRDGLVPLAVPLGDVADVVAIDAAQALAGEADAVRRITARYGVRHAVLAEAVVEGELPPAETAVKIVLRSLTDAGIPPVEIAGHTGDGEDSGAVFARLVGEAVVQFEEGWKRANLVRGDTSRALAAIAALAGLEDWTALRARLAGQPLIERIEVQSLARDRVRLVLHHFGDQSQLVAALAQANLVLTADGAEWRLGPPPAERKTP